MKLSIIVPVYNVENYLDQCILSLYNQGLKETDFEVILIDDGSTDSSLDIARKWSNQHDNIKVYHQENQGQAIARNLGIENANGEYLMFVDSDDYLYKNSLSGPLMNIIENDYDCMHFGMAIEEADGSVFHRYIKGGRLNNIYSGEYVVLNFDFYGSICPYIFKSDIFKANQIRFKGGFAHEDCELCYRLFPKISNMYFYDGVVYHYRYNQNSTDRSKKLSSIRRIYNSDLLIAAELKKIIDIEDISPKLKKHYKRLSNSLVTSHYLSYKKNPRLFDTKAEYYSLLKTLGLFHLSGRCLSIQSTCLLYVLNFKSYLFKLRSNFKILDEQHN